MFDVPPNNVARLHWQGELPIDNDDWHIGLIVGPSGSGKSTIARSIWGENFQTPLNWQEKCVLDDFAQSLGIETITAACQAVGFNTIPAWLRPFSVLSNGERFRVDLARRVLELPDPIIVDEFSSVVDRQIAQIASHAVQKFIRRNKRKFVAISCHHDIIDWLQPDWIFEPATMIYTPRRALQRPKLEVTIGRLSYSAWKLFAPYHYLTAHLHRSAQCFGLWVGDRLSSFAGMLPRPVSSGTFRGTCVIGCSRAVTFPDWQGLGLIFVLMETLGAAHKALHERYHIYPAHAPFVRACARSTAWTCLKKPGIYESHPNPDKTRTFGGRPNAVFEYCGPAMDLTRARMLLRSDA